MNKSKNRKLNLTDILVTIVVALVFGLVFRVLEPVYNVLQPLGLHLDALIYGIWFIAGPFAALLIRKPGVALLAEVAASMAEVLFGGSGGIINFYYGIVQGLFSEAIFAAWRYQKFTISVSVLSGVAAALGSFIIDLFYGYLVDLAGWNLTLSIVFRLIGGALLGGAFSDVLVKALEKMGVTNLVRPVTKDDYDVLKK